MQNAPTIQRNTSKVPVIDDPRPRMARMSIDMDLSQCSLEMAWQLLRPMAEARGYRGLTIGDVELYAASPLDTIAAKLSADNEEFVFHLIPCGMLLSNFTWLLKFGQDAVLSSPSN